MCSSGHVKYICGTCAYILYSVTCDMQQKYDICVSNLTPNMKLWDISRRIFKCQVTNKKFGIGCSNW